MKIFLANRDNHHGSAREPEAWPGLLGESFCVKQHGWRAVFSCCGADSTGRSLLRSWSPALPRLHTLHRSYFLQMWFWNFNMILISSFLRTLQMIHNLTMLPLSFTAFSDGFYHFDQRSMTGITVGVCIALICIIICTFIIVCRGKNRYSLWVNAVLTSFLTNKGYSTTKAHFPWVSSEFWYHVFFFSPYRKFSAVKTQREGMNTSVSAAGHLGSDRQVEDMNVTMPAMSQNHFLDTKVLNTWYSM